MYELKRGKLSRDAVTQVLDYASALNAMSEAELAEHVSNGSGSAGIQQIDDFEQWYIDTCGGDDLSRLLPPRMVLIGLGIDETAERIARFVSAGAVDLSVITFHGFRQAGDADTLLARQTDVSPDDRPRTETISNKRRALRKYLEEHDYAPLFDRVYDDIRRRVHNLKLSELPGKTGITFRLTDPDDRSWNSYFGMTAGYIGPDIYTVSILPQARNTGGEEMFHRLAESVDLRDWDHGGHVLSFKNDDEWEQVRSAVLEFVDAAVHRNALANP